MKTYTEKFNEAVDNAQALLRKFNEQPLARLRLKKELQVQQDLADHYGRMAHIEARSAAGA